MPTLTQVIDEFPAHNGTNAQGYFRHAYRQSEVISSLKEAIPDDELFANASGGCCYNICFSLAAARLQTPPMSFTAFAGDRAQQILAVMNQTGETFEITSRNLRVGDTTPRILERTRTERKPSSPIVTNATLTSSLDIVNTVLRERCVAMLCLSPAAKFFRAAGSGHAVLFDTRNSAAFFDPNHGWFEVLGVTIQNGFFANWFDRFYHASPYKSMFEHGPRKLVIW